MCIRDRACHFPEKILGTDKNLPATEKNLNQQENVKCVQTKAKVLEQGSGRKHSTTVHHVMSLCVSHSALLYFTQKHQIQINK